MNLIDAAQEPLPERLLFFALVFVLSALLTGFAIVRSKRLSDFLEALSDERLPAGDKLATLLAVWRGRRPPRGG
jgi:hypothetical protein